MNERIKDLALQAGFKTDRLGHLFGGDDIEKFAELIVRECSETVKQQSDDHCSEDWNRCANDCAVIVLEHFGVE